MKEFSAKAQLTFRRAVAAGLSFPFTYEHVHVTSARDRPRRDNTTLSVAFNVYTKTPAAAQVAEDVLRAYLPLNDGREGFLQHLRDQSILDGTGNFTSALEAVSVVKEPDAGAGTGQMDTDDGSGSGIYLVVSAVVLSVGCCCCATVQLCLWLQRDSLDGKGPAEKVLMELKAVRTRAGSQAYSHVQLNETDDGEVAGDTFDGRISMDSADGGEETAATDHMVGGMASIESLRQKHKAIDGVPIRVDVDDVEDVQDEESEGASML